MCKKITSIHTGACWTSCEGEKANRVKFFRQENWQAENRIAKSCAKYPAKGHWMSVRWQGQGYTHSRLQQTRNEMEFASLWWYQWLRQCGGGCSGGWMISHACITSAVCLRWMDLFRGNKRFSQHVYIRNFTTCSMSFSYVAWNGCACVCAHRAALYDCSAAWNRCFANFRFNCNEL